MSQSHSWSRQRTVSWPLQGLFRIGNKRSDHRDTLMILLFFLFSLLPCKPRALRYGGTGGTQSHSIFSLLLLNAASASLPSPFPPRTRQTSSHPPAMCCPCAAKLPVPSTSMGWQQLQPISTQLQKPLCSSASLLLELEIDLKSPCTMKSRTRVAVGNLKKEREKGRLNFFFY